MKVEFLAKFFKDLDKISDHSIKNEIVQVIESIEAANSISEIKNVKKMVGYKHSYRIRLGDYRIGFYYENKIIELARVVHRKDIYKVFP